jgi:molybdate transport system substrate-binding protein
MALRMVLKIAQRTALKMLLTMLVQRFCILFVVAALSNQSHGDFIGTPTVNEQTINIAVACNFLSTAKQLETLFEKNTPYSINIITASTGQLSHQILNAAPFSVFLSANKQHPQSLQSELNLPADNLFQYAQGSLLLVSHNPINQIPSFTLPIKNPKATYTELEKNIVRQVLESANKVAIANQKLAPYGRATIEALTTLDLLSTIKNKTITGQNIAQTHQFFTSKSVDAAFIAKSQLSDLTLQSNMDKKSIKGIIAISRQWHKPIEQWGLLIKESPAAKAFVTFIASSEALMIIKNNGYDTPN